MHKQDISAAPQLVFPIGIDLDNVSEKARRHFPNQQLVHFLTAKLLSHMTWHTARCCFLHPMKKCLTAWEAGLPTKSYLGNSG